MILQSTKISEIIICLHDIQLFSRTLRRQNSIRLASMAERLGGFASLLQVPTGSHELVGSKGNAALLPTTVELKTIPGTDEQGSIENCSRRRFLLLSSSTAALSTLHFSYDKALAVKQNLLAGRIPGLSAPDVDGLRTYSRPEAKSGGHGVGWSPIIPYSFKVSDGWEEVPVSIADLGGTEIDLRFSSKQEGNLSVVVAPVLRFSSDLGDDATMEKIGPPEKVIDAFGPELVGQNVEGQVKDMMVKQHDGRTYYVYELNVPHVLITATAAGNRLYLMTVSANARQWKKYGNELKNIAESFRVD
ncbi:hypothetical protein KP509_35G021700 [Ceratopteris richardii]|uniref:PsbP C-terminal domain-containing protein n=1 Tax=Ceratopteris richardii TaxID=49495 RepID=A0A8T2QFQ6_CERRI|nr:hypothetical protein KP509_35G021700 [Ceratopteris richardii]